jgi:hypothetical protein
LNILLKRPFSRAPYNIIDVLFCPIGVWIRGVPLYVCIYIPGEIADEKRRRGESSKEKRKRLTTTVSHQRSGRGEELRASSSESPAPLVTEDGSSLR